MREKVRDAGSLIVRHRAAKLLFSDVLVRDRLNHVRAGDEHVGSLVHHDDEVGNGRRIDGASRARAHDGRNLRNYPAV